MHTQRTHFASGAACGAAVTTALFVLLGINQPQPAATSTNAEPTTAQYAASDYFVTGDTSVASLWRRESDGSLTCISTNACRGGS